MSSPYRNSPHQQLALDLIQPLRPSLDNFVVGRNAEVIAALRNLAAGGSERFVYLWGGEGSGRTHLLQAIAASAASRWIDGASAPVEFDPPYGSIWRTTSIVTTQAASSSSSCCKTRSARRATVRWSPAAAPRRPSSCCAKTSARGSRGVSSTSFTACPTPRRRTRCARTPPRAASTCRPKCSATC